MNVTHVGRSLAAGPAHYGQLIGSQNKQAGIANPFEAVGGAKDQSTANVERIRQIDISLYDEIAKYLEQSEINEMLSVSYYV